MMETIITKDELHGEYWTKTNNLRVVQSTYDGRLLISTLQQMEKSNLGNEKWVNVEIITENDN